MATLNISMIIRAIDQATAPIRRIKEAMKGLENNRGIKALQGYARTTGKLFGWAADKAKELAKWAVVGAAAAMTAFGVAVFRTGIQFEQFLAQLETTEGSAAKAKAAMSWVQTFAATTPYELATVMDAFIKLRAYGITPTDGTLRTLGDTASSMGKDLMSAVEALADAMTGEFERLKEFGVKVKVQGNQVQFNFTQNGKAMVVSAKNNATDIRKALLGIWDRRFAGGMERQSRTLGGILSNLADWWTGFKRQIGDAGVFDYVKGKVSNFLNSLQTPAGAAKAKALAKNISDGMIKGLKYLETAFKGFDFGKFIADLAAIVGFGAKVVKFLGGIGGVIDTVVVGAIANLGYTLGSIAVAIGAAFGVAALPIALTVAAITGVIAIGYLVVRHWGQIKAWFVDMWTDFTARVSAQADRWGVFFKNLWTGAKQVFAAGVEAVWNILPWWLRAMIQGGLKLSMMVNGAVANAAKAPASPTVPGQPPAAPRGRGTPLWNPNNRASSGTPLWTPTPRRPAPGPAWSQPQRSPAANANRSAPGAPRDGRVDGRIVVELKGDQSARVRSVRTAGHSDLDLMVDRGIVGYGA